MNGLIKNDSVLKAFYNIKREDFLPKYLKDLAYEDLPLPISEKESMNQISTTLIFIDAINAKKGDNIYLVGAGSGYSSAILSEIVGPKGKVLSFEIDKEIFEKAKKNLKKFKNVKVKLANGFIPDNSFAPYDGIIIFGAVEEAPKELINMLKVDSSIVFPKGMIIQSLMKITRKIKGLKSEKLGEYRLKRLIKL